MQARLQQIQIAAKVKEEGFTSTNSTENEGTKYPGSDYGMVGSSIMKCKEKADFDFIAVTSASRLRNVFKSTLHKTRTSILSTCRFQGCLVKWPKAKLVGETQL